MTNARDKANIPVLNFQSKGIDDNADATAITIDSSERVGILQTSPNSNLHVSSGGNTKVRFDGNSNSNTSTFLISHVASGDVGLQFNSNQLNMFSYGDIAFYPSTSNISGSYPNNEVMRIRNNGKIGIGTSAPTSNLSIQTSSGEATADLKTTALDTGVNFTLNGNKTSNGGIGSIIFSNNGDSVAMIRSNRASANDASDMLFYTQATGGANSERMRISSAGLVGIGTGSV